MLSDRLPPFALKAFLMGPEAKAARHDLSASYCQPLVLDRLLAFEDGAAQLLRQTKLGYPGLRRLVGAAPRDCRAL